jgi:hypothetical protein
MPSAAKLQPERDRQHRAERRARRHAERERRGERIAQQPLKDHAGPAASVAPTSAAASVRGSRATKRIWASVFSANEIRWSSARQMSMRVDPMSGETTIAASAADP